MRRHGHARIARALLAVVPPLFCLGLFFIFYLPIRRYLGVPSPRLGLVAWDCLRGLPGLLHGRWSALDIPLLDGFKHGSGEFYVTIPFVALFGHTPAAMLSRDGVLGGLAVWTTYLLGLALYRDRWTSFFAALFLATSPTFVLYSMIGGRAGIAETALAPAALYFLLRYADERQTRLACLGSAALGLAFACRSTMAAFIVGLLVYAAFYRRAAAGLLPAQSVRRRRLLLGCFISFFAFVCAFAWACAVHLGEFWSYWSQRFGARDEVGNNLDYAGNLLQRLRQMANLAEGKDGLWFFVERTKAFPSSSLAFPAAALAIAAILLVVRRKETPRRWTMPWVVAIVYLLLSPFTPSMARVMHLFP
ncbi:MAG TPA: glycosyltransferase family 39 protein, partial [Elusimicrobiota bacterium]|nr:glycosyltransferase family 39 protein [Elusimicrobiota bacterium]